MSIEGASPVYERVSDLRERLNGSISIFPIPGLISALLITILLNFVTTSTNFHLGQQSSVITLTAPKQNVGGLWLSVYLKNDQLIINTNDKQTFSWPAKNWDQHSLLPFLTYMKFQKNRLFNDFVLNLKPFYHQSNVIIAIDQNLNYYHFKPILHVLAQTGFNRYSFETIIAK